MKSTRNFLKSLRVLLLMLVAVSVVAGCGGSSEQFVYTSTGTGTPNPVNIGSLTFTNLDQMGLPADTTKLDFDFYAGTNVTGNPLHEASVSFSPTVTVNAIPDNANVVLITAYYANGAPVATTTAPVSILPGQNRIVDLAGATVTPVTVTSVVVTPATDTVAVGATQQFAATTTFSNGQIVTGGVIWSVVNVSQANPNATVDATGLATGVAVGVSQIVATRGTLLGAPSGSAQLTVAAAPANTNPVVTLNHGVLEYTRDELAVPLDANATVTDPDDSNLDGGTLTMTSSTTDLKIGTLLGFTDVGTITGSGTASLSVALNANATLPNIQSFLRAVTVSTSGGTAIFGQRTVTVKVADSSGRFGTDNRAVNVQNTGAVTRTVGIPGATDVSIQGAVDFIEAVGNGGGSRIVVGSGSYLAEGIIDISNVDLDGLTIEGPNVGISAGNVAGTRVAPANVAAFVVDNRVLIDGFDVKGINVPSAGGVAGVFFGSLASNSIVANTSFINNPAVPTGQGVVNESGGTSINLTIMNNRFEGWTSGTFLQGKADGTVPSTGNLVQGNLFDKNGSGSRNDAVKDCEFSDNTYGSATLFESLGFSKIGQGNHVHGNSFLTANAVNLYGTGNANVNVRGNWWGQTTGPIGSQINPEGGGPGKVNNASDFLTVDPFPALP